MQYDSFLHLPPGSNVTIEMQPGDTLFRQDQPTSGLFHVQSGCVTLSRTSRDGATLTLHRASSGGYFAEASIFSDRYHCDAVCTQAGRVVKIAKDAVIKAMRADPAFSESFTRLLAVQVQQYRAHIELLAIRSAKERVLAAVSAGYLVTTIPDFASRISLTHEACYRGLRALCDEGRMIRTGRGQYALP